METVLSDEVPGGIGFVELMAQDAAGHESFETLHL